MLYYLKIHNIALIDDLTVEFTGGMNCLTGETGAGKSIVIDSIECVLGGRTYKDIIKSGEDSAYVDALFYDDSPEIDSFFDETGIPKEPDNSILVHREMNLSGRNVCRINGCITTVSMLKKLGALLIDIHGQTDNQSLLNVDEHIKLLDSFCGKELEELKEKYFDTLSVLKKLDKELKNLSGSPEERAQLIDLYSYQIEEIDKANIYATEDEDLISKRNLLLNYEKISENLTNAYGFMEGGDYSEICAGDLMKKAAESLKSIARFSDKYNEIYESILNVTYIVDDIVASIRHEKENSFYDKEELNDISNRIDFLSDLKRKYNKTLSEIIILKDELQEKINELKSSENRVTEVSAAIEDTCSELYEICEDMNFTRVKSAHIIEKEICKQLADVELKNSDFKVDIFFETEKNNNGRYFFTENGLDNVQFLVSTNQGEPVKPLNKVASGGEMSRIMLAIKTILAEVDNIPTLIFDEIDTGISGAVTNKIAEKLKIVSSKHQVLCVTHHAPIAAIADNNIVIEKKIENGKTRTYIRMLDDETKIHEVARLLDGDSQSEISLMHAKNLIERLS